MVQDVVFDLGGVVFRWQPLVLLQELFPTTVTNETVASEWAHAIFQTFHPEADWALFDLGLIEPEPLAKRIAQRTGLAEADLLHLIANIPPHLLPIQGTVDLIHDLKAQGHRLFFCRTCLLAMQIIWFERMIFLHCLKKVFFLHMCSKSNRSSTSSPRPRHAGRCKERQFLLMMFSTTSMLQLYMAGNRFGLKHRSKCGLHWSV